MATEIYKTGVIFLIDGTEVELSPLKIKYLREFMLKFEDMKDVSTNDEAMTVLAECARICMKQFYPSIKTLEDLGVDIDFGDYVGYYDSENFVRYYTVVNDGRVVSDTKHTYKGFKPFYKTIIAAPVGPNEFRGI